LRAGTSFHTVAGREMRVYRKKVEDIAYGLVRQTRESATLSFNEVAGR